MVFARTKLVLEDNCFEEEPGTVTIRLVGPHVTKLYTRMYELMKSVFNVTDSDIQETMYQWGKGKGKEKFSVTWWLHKDMDIFSYFYIRFRLKGQGNGETGTATIEVRGLLRSEYPQDTVWQRSLFYEMLRTFWHRAFYHRKREEYAEECRHSVILFQKKIHEIFKRLKEGE
jgi:hypothetical protein